MEIISGKYLIKIIDKDSPLLKEAQILRYEHLLREFDHNLPKKGIDDDGFDQYCYNLVVIDTSINKLIANYRMSTLESSNGHPFKTEEEFDISQLKKEGHILELGRAVIHKDYRSTIVLELLWASILKYCQLNNIKYCFGTVSFKGVNPNIYPNLLSYMKGFRSEFNIRSIKNSIEYFDTNFDLEKANEEMPPLLNGYLKLNAKLSHNLYCDTDFNSIDCLAILTISSINPRYIKLLERLTK